MTNNNSNETQANEAVKSIDLKFEIFRYLQYWYWFALSLLISMSVAYFYLRYTPNVYTTQAKIKILDNSSSSFKMPSVGGVSLFARPRVNLENEIEILKSFLINEQVVKELGLTTNIIQLGYISEISIWKTEPFVINWGLEIESLDEKEISFEIELLNEGFKFIDEIHSKIIPDEVKYGESIVLNDIPLSIELKDDRKYAYAKYRVTKSTLRNATYGVIGSLNIANVGKESEVLSLSMNGENKDKIEDIVNKIVRIFDIDGIRDRQKISERTIEFVKERFVSLTKELDSIEFGKANYKSKNLLSFINADATIAASQKELASNELLKTELQVELSKILDQLLKAKTDQLLPGDLGIENSGINLLISDYNKVVLEMNKLAKSSGENFPGLNAFKSQIEDLRQSLLISADNYRKQLKVTVKQLSEIENSTISLYSTIPEKERVLRAIERQQQIKESLYLILLTKREEAAINLAITEPSIKVVDFSITSNAPISPKRSVILLGAFMLGLLLPFGALYLYFISDTKIHVKDDLLAVLPNVTVAAEIPHLEKDKMVMDANDRSVLGEAFRILRTNISYLLPLKEDSDRAFVIFTTSTIKGEGKTFTSTNTAVAFTALNKKVLLIGADVRNPQLHKFLNVDKNQKGLTSYLYDNKVTWQETRNLAALGIQNLDVIFSGPIPPNPAELLSNGRLEQLLEEAKDVYDYIIVDTAPTILVTDTLLISQLADVTLYMVRANYTDKNLLNFIKELNEQKKLKNMAFVLNDIGSGKAYGYGYGYGYGYKYNYAYNYGYGYGYSEEVGGEKKKKSIWSKILRK
jgi:tyrosine-protein kinase Etk/Wzc